MDSEAAVSATRLTTYHTFVEGRCGIGAMAEQMQTELVFVKRHIRKYLLKNLDPELAGACPNSRTIRQSLAVMLTRNMVQVSTDRSLPARKGELPLRIRTDLGGQISLKDHNDVMELVTSTFFAEFYRTVDKLHLTLGVAQHFAIAAFRDQYAITEDDWPLKHSERYYQRHLARTQRRKRRRGRPMLPFEHLKDQRERERNRPGRIVLTAPLVQGTLF